MGRIRLGFTDDMISETIMRRILHRLSSLANPDNS